MDAQYEARRAAVVDLAHERERGLADQEARRAALQVLREYGVVLQEYPVLIQFLALPEQRRPGRLCRPAGPAVGNGNLRAIASSPPLPVRRLSRAVWEAAPGCVPSASGPGPPSPATRRSLRRC